MMMTVYFQLRVEQRRIEIAGIKEANGSCPGSVKYTLGRILL
jgi:hypothetical protein